MISLYIKFWSLYIRFFLFFLITMDGMKPWLDSFFPDSPQSLILKKNLSRVNHADSFSLLCFREGSQEGTQLILMCRNTMLPLHTALQIFFFFFIKKLIRAKKYENVQQEETNAFFFCQKAHSQKPANGGKKIYAHFFNNLACWKVSEAMGPSHQVWRRIKKIFCCCAVKICRGEWWRSQLLGTPRSTVFILLL